jgi:uncharacterized membrane protein
VLPEDVALRCWKEAVVAEAIAGLTHLRVVRRSAAYVTALVVLAALLVGVAAAVQGEGPASAAPAVAAAPCTATALATLGGAQGNAVAVSSNGLVTGYAEDSRGTPQPVLWQAGKLTRIATGLVNVSPTGVNSRGEVVGRGVESSTLEEVGWQWFGGRTSLLKAPAGTVAVPSAISNSGLIVGALASDDDGAANPTSGEAPERAATWASASAAAKLLPVLPGDVGAHAYAVNKNGVVVGNSQAEDHFTPVVWDASGHVTALPAIAGGWGIARGIDDSGVVVGDAAPASGDPEALTWDLRHHQKRLGTAHGRATQGKGLVHGRAVGQTEVRGADGVDRPQALLWDDTGNAAPLPPLPGDSAAGVNAAADGGLVAGFSSNARAMRRPMTWTCAP